ncbi:hypothetical protein C8R44DRAFT_798430 [Mycena epipterygia]|nr:hypothetical protein C8R44DRAFT_798430 [Mycena epipterygia]
MDKENTRSGEQDSHTGRVASAVDQWEAAGARQMGLTYWMGLTSWTGRERGRSAGSCRSAADRTHILDGSRVRSISGKLQERSRWDSPPGQVASVVDQREAAGARQTGLTCWTGREHGRSAGSCRSAADRTHMLDRSRAWSISGKLQERSRRDSHAGQVASAVDQREAAGARQTGLTSWTGRECGRSAGSCRSAADGTHLLDRSRVRSISGKLQERSRWDSPPGQVASAVDQREAAGAQQMGLTNWTGRECGRSAGSCRSAADGTHVLDRSRVRSISGKLQERGRWDSHAGQVASAVDQQEAAGARQMGLTRWTGRECGRSAGSCRSAADGTHRLDRSRARSISGKLQERSRWDSPTGQVASAVDQREAAGAPQMGLTSWTGRECGRSAGSCRSAADGTHRLDGSRVRSISEKLKEHGRQDSRPGRVASTVDQREAAGAQQTGLTNWTGREHSRSARSCRSAADRTHRLDGSRARSISEKLKERGRQDSQTGQVMSMVNQRELQESGEQDAQTAWVARSSCMQRSITFIDPQM